MVDVEGNWLATVVRGGDVSENTGGVELLDQVAREFPSLRQVWCDQGFKKTFVEHADDLGVEVTVVDREPGTKGFVVLPRRWMVERFFGWVNRCRRLGRSYERLVANCEAEVQMAYLRIMLRRLTR